LTGNRPNLLLGTVVAGELGADDDEAVMAALLMAVTEVR
jgi:hypothetical protein